MESWSKHTSLICFTRIRIQNKVFIRIYLQKYIGIKIYLKAYNNYIKKTDSNSMAIKNIIKDTIAVI